MTDDTKSRSWQRLPPAIRLFAVAAASVKPGPARTLALALLRAARLEHRALNGGPPPELPEDVEAEIRAFTSGA